MRSAAAPSATVLVVVTLVFAPVAKHNYLLQKVLGKSTTTKVEVTCAPKERCSTSAAEDAVVRTLVSKSTTKVEVKCRPNASCPSTARATERVDAANASKKAIEAAKARAIKHAVAAFRARTQNP